MGVFTRTGNPDALKLFTLYAATITFRGKVLGGVPKNPELVEGWLRSKAGITDTEELRQAMLRTLYEMGVDVDADMTFEQAVEASKKVSSAKQTTGFKTDIVRDKDGSIIGGAGVYLESRQLKAGLKENINILYAGERVGPTRKGAKNYAAERVFVAPERLYLLDDTGKPFVEPSGIELMIGHVNGPAGPRSTLTYHEYVLHGTFKCTLMVAEDSINATWWPRVWTLMENNGLGACRSQGFGTFDIEQWDNLGHPTAAQYDSIIKADQMLLSAKGIPDNDAYTFERSAAELVLADMGNGR